MLALNVQHHRLANEKMDFLVAIEVSRTMRIGCFAGKLAKRYADGSLW